MVKLTYRLSKHLEASDPSVFNCPHRFVYLLISPEGPVRRAQKYVGITTQGLKRYDGHLKLGGETDWWIKRLAKKQLVPYHLVLERAQTDQQLQILETIYIHTMRLMGENLMNKEFDRGGWLPPTPTRPEHPFANTQEFHNDIERLIPPMGLKTVYSFLTDLAEKYGGYQPEIERFKVVMAKESLVLGTPKLYAIPNEMEPVVEVQKPKKWSCLGAPGCTGAHHSFGLCQSHADKRRNFISKIMKSLKSSYPLLLANNPTASSRIAQQPQIHLLRQLASVR